MGVKTKISWCDSTINPIMGCTGCALRKNHCYAAILCARYAGRKGWPKSFDQPEFFPGRLEKAAKWGDLAGKARSDKPWLNGLPRHIFVNDMSDGFCPDVDAWGWLLPYLDMMEESPHIWMLLTKWPDRMREFFGSIGGAPDNFWLGVSIESQAAADERIPLLLGTPAAVRFVSAEPLLGLTNLTPCLYARDVYDFHCDSIEEFPDGRLEMKEAVITGVEFVPGLDWVIVGGESGPGARPMRPDWAKGIKDQCVAAGVPFFFKQWGAWLPFADWPHGYHGWKHAYSWEPPYDGRPDMVRVGKKVAGRLLGGREWNEMPRRVDEK